MRRSTLYALFVFALAITASAQIQAVATKKDLAISGATPGDRVAVCRIANQRIDGAETLLRQESVVTADAKGMATVTAEVEAHQAIWLAVDLSTGDYVVAIPPNYKARSLAPPLISRPGVSTFTWSRPSMEVWVVKRGTGIWHGEVADGTASDDDGKANGIPTFNLTRLEKKADFPTPPLALAPGDVVLVADASWMVYAVTVVPKGASGAN